MKKADKIAKKALEFIYPVIGVGIFVLVWYLIALKIDIDMILPTPARMFEELASLLTQKVFWIAVRDTFLRALSGFGIAFLVATLLAILAYLLPPIGKIFSPVVTIARAVPTMSIILLALIWLSSKTAPLLIAFLLVFPVLYSSFASALSGIDGKLIDMSKVFGIPLYKRIFSLYIPSVAPMALDAMTSGISLAIKVTIAGEVLAQTSASMGLQMQNSRAYLDTASLLAWTFVAVAIGYLSECVVRLIKKLTIRWQK